MSLLPRELLIRFIRPSFSPSSLNIYRFNSTSTRTNVIDELESRGMVSELTSRAVRKHLDKPATVYLGVDPSASSLHVGNLLALIGLLHFRLQGHSAIALIGGATGSVGDPSGRSTERNALSPIVLQTNSEAITKQVTNFLTNGLPFARSRNSPRYTMKEASGSSLKEGEIKVVNNLEWLGGVGLLEFLSKVGKFSRMSTMLSRDSVKSRLDSSSGLSFTEFSYQLLQAFDFLTLHKSHNCTIQLGGSDQLGNIMSGIELIRRTNLSASSSDDVIDSKVKVVKGKEEVDVEDVAYGVTMPLLTTASGEKFGKSAGNAIWLDPSMTSPFELYQFFLRTTDEEVEKYLQIFSFIRVIELKAIIEDHKANSGLRVAQKMLAAEATELVHGTQGLRQAIAATNLFYSTPENAKPITQDLVNSLDAISNSTDTATTYSIPSMLIKLSKVEMMDKPIEVIINASGLFSSKNQTRKAIEGGTISLNGVKLPSRSHQRLLEEKDILGCGIVVLKYGKSVHKVVLLE